LVKPRFDLATGPVLPQHDGAASIEADDVKRILADIDAMAAMVAIGFLDIGGF
jgi:hypothetical protein